MGGWMTYQRLRGRNLLMARKSTDDLDPYWRDGRPNGGLIGDLNRMERDYLNPLYPSSPFASRPDGSSPAEQCASATGLPVEDVRRVLRFVFLEQP